MREWRGMFFPPSPLRPPLQHEAWRGGRARRSVAPAAAARLLPVAVPSGRAGLRLALALLPGGNVILLCGGGARWGEMVGAGAESDSETTGGGCF